MFHVFTSFFNRLSTNNGIEASFCDTKFFFCFAIESHRTRKSMRKNCMEGKIFSESAHIVSTRLFPWLTLSHLTSSLSESENKSGV